MRTVSPNTAMVPELRRRIYGSRDHEGGNRRAHLL